MFLFSKAMEKPLKSFTGILFYSSDQYCPIYLIHHHSSFSIIHHFQCKNLWHLLSSGPGDEIQRHVSQASHVGTIFSPRTSLGDNCAPKYCKSQMDYLNLIMTKKIFVRVLASCHLPTRSHLGFCKQVNVDPESASLSIIIASKKIVSILNASGEKLHRGYCNVILEALKLFKNRHNEYSTYVRSMGSTENGMNLMKSR